MIRRLRYWLARCTCPKGVAGGGGWWVEYVERRDPYCPRHRTEADA